MRIKRISLVLCALALASFGGGENGGKRNYRQDMRDLVGRISRQAKAVRPDFVVIPQNGLELTTENGEATGKPATDYLDAIDGVGQEDLLYGYPRYGQASRKSFTDYLQPFLGRVRAAGKTVLVIDYCSTPAKMDDSYARNNAAGYVSFAADRRELNRIPAHPSPIYDRNNTAVASLRQVKNFLYLINPSEFASKEAFVDAVRATGYDLLVMDLFFDGNEAFTSSEVERLRDKADGGRRLVVAYLSVGEAEEYRYYWQKEWKRKPPHWLDAENPDWDGNFKVKYWDPGWQDILCGKGDSYLNRILDAGFDGVYLDIIDAFEYFEK